MSVDVGVPQPFLTNLGLSGAVDFDLDDIHISFDALPAINTNLTSTNQVNTDSQIGLSSKNTVQGKLNLDTAVDLKSESTANVATDSKLSLESRSQLDLGLDNLRIKELPELKFEFGIRPMRVRFPVKFKFGMRLFGLELFSLETLGESSVVIENT